MTFLQFDESLKRLDDKLNRSTTVSELDAVDTLSYRHKLEGIMNTPEKRKGRTDEAIEADVRNGMIGEYAVAKLLGVDVYDQVWDLKDPHSYGKDVIYDGVRIEVKSHAHLRHFTILESSFHTLSKKLLPFETFDVILFAHRERTSIEGYWTVTPTLIVDPYPVAHEFMDCWDKGDYSYVYRADLCAPKNLCHPLIELEI